MQKMSITCSLSLVSSVGHLFDGPLEVLLLKRLSGERISKEEALAAVEVLHSTDGKNAIIVSFLAIGDNEEVIDLEGDADQLWPGGHRSADQGRLADGGGAAGDQLRFGGVAQKLLHITVAALCLCLCL